MTWDIETCYYEYQEATSYLLKSLGITQLDHVKNREVLYPYYTQIIKYLNRELMCNTEDNIKAKVQKIIDLMDAGSEKICTTRARELGEEVGIEVTSEYYDQDRFVFSWADLMGTLGLRLKFQYAYLWKQEYRPFPMEQSDDDDHSVYHSILESVLPIQFHQFLE